MSASIANVHSHPESCLGENALGERFLPYHPTYDFTGEHIDADHRRVAGDIGIEGWLCLQDRLKLYELAYFSPGDVLELGCYRGLSTNIMAAALRNAGSRRRLFSLDINAETTADARRNTAEFGDLVSIVVSDAHAYCQALTAQGRRYGFCFVDHSHTYNAVRQACRDLEPLVEPGGLIFFHDYNDGRNGRDPEYGVYQAVQDAVRDGGFRLLGVYGCGALVMRVAKA